MKRSVRICLVALCSVLFVSFLGSGTIYAQANIVEENTTEANAASETTDADDDEKGDLLGTYSTNYENSTDNRIANIEAAVSYIDGTVLLPGEEFSFVDTVGPFTEANGYYTATSYSAGEIVESMGGGVCQVSTTLYNAVLRAELTVTERNNHSMTVDYVPLAADAMIATGSSDFCFRNDYADAVTIEAEAVDGVLTISIYGTETRDENRTIEFVSITEEVIDPGEDVVTEDGSLSEGSVIVTQATHMGYVASLYKYIYIDGELESKEVINTSTYKASPRYITIGTGKEN